MQRVCLVALFFCSFLSAWAESLLPGRWVFYGLSDSGRRVPLFIAEFQDTGDRPRLISTSAPFALELQNVSFQDSQVVLEIRADGKRLTLTGTLDNGIVKGRASGETLNGLAFVAEPTILSELQKPVAPPPEQIEAFRTAESAEAPVERASLMREFLNKHPETALKTAALLVIFQAVLEGGRSDEEVVLAIDEAIESAPDKATVRNDLAYTLAEAGKLLAKAEELARAAVREAVPGTTAEANFLDTLAWVLDKKGDREQAVLTLRQALSLAPRQADIALRLAGILEDQGNVDEAISVYLQAHVATINRTARAKARELFLRKHGSLDGFHELLDEAYSRRGPLFDTGRYQGSRSAPPAVLAELFTGAQCGPCQAADFGFDALLEHYPEDVVTVLEYHLHVPGPDPMSNPDSAARGRFYQIRSTPVAVFGGQERVPGGGPISRAEVAFAHYREAINALLEQEVEVELDLEARRENDQITAKGTIKLAASSNGETIPKPRLFLALVEKTVHYTGQNGVHLHRHVVRRFLNGAEGQELSSTETTFEAGISIAEVEEGQKQYLEKLKQEWEVVFEEAPVTFNREDLAIVAFVQDLQSRKVLGAVTTHVK